MESAEKGNEHIGGVRRKIAVQSGWVGIRRMRKVLKLCAFDA